MERISKTDLYSIVAKGLWLMLLLSNAGQSYKSGDYGWSIAFLVLLIPYGFLTRLEVNKAYERANRVDVKTDDEFDEEEDDESTGSN